MYSTRWVLPSEYYTLKCPNFSGPGNMSKDGLSQLLSSYGSDESENSSDDAEELTAVKKKTGSQSMKLKLAKTEKGGCENCGITQEERQA